MKLLRWNYNPPYFAICQGWNPISLLSIFFVRFNWTIFRLEPLRLGAGGNSNVIWEFDEYPIPISFSWRLEDKTFRRHFQLLVFALSRRVHSNVKYLNSQILKVFKQSDGKARTPTSPSKLIFTNKNQKYLKIRVLRFCCLYFVESAKVREFTNNTWTLMRIPRGRWISKTENLFRKNLVK